MSRARKAWSAADLATLRRMYARHATTQIAARLGRHVSHVYAKAYALRLRKSAEYLAGMDAGRMRPGDARGASFRFQKGHVPANKGLRRPGWQRGRMAEHWFQAGHRSTRWDPEVYAVGALRVNSDGYVDMKMHDGPRAWKQLHRILWEDAHGQVPRGHVLRFKDGDKLNVEIANLELIARAELMRCNTVHNLPQPLRSTIHVLGQLKRRIREKQNRGSSQSPVRDARGPARRG